MKSKKFSISFQDESFQKVLPLNVGQYTIGSDHRCDLVIEHDDVSKYLGVILVTKDKLTFVNTANSVNDEGKIILREEIKSNLKLSEGSFEFSFKSEIIELPDMPEMSPELHADLPAVPEVTGAFDLDKVQIYNKSGSELRFIDDEWCDIVFDESGYQPVANYAYTDNFEIGEFVDTDEEIDADKAHRDTFKQAEKYSVEIAFLVNGIVTNLDYFSATESKIYLSGERESYNTFMIETFEHKKYAFAFCKKNDVVLVRDIPGFEKHIRLESGKLEAVAEQEITLTDQTIVFTSGVTEIIVKLKLLPPKVKLAPWIQMEKELAKIAAALCLALFLPIMAIVFFTTIEQAEKKKEVAVIYKKIKGVKADSKVSQAVAGPINKEQPKKQEEKKAEPKKTVEKKVVQQKTPSKNKKVTKTKPAKAKFKRYSFNSVSKVSSILGKTDNVNVKVTDQSEAVSALPSSSSNALAKGFGEVKQKVGTLGKGGGRAGYDRNVAGTGYGSKNGVDTSYISSETKVLGSIDPELIRKILREHLEQFRYCYQKELLNNDVSGVFYLDFQIDQAGRAPMNKTQVSTKSFKFSSQTIGCLRKVIGLIQFPQPKGGGVVDIRQPLNFVSAKSR